MRAFDAVVVGAGPAGLSAAAELARTGSTLVLDAGPLATHRRRDSPEDILEGVGGAGLFSDGKHSFYPSASALWALPDTTALAGAYAATAALLRTYGVEAGPLPAGPPAPLAAGDWQAKLYPALYIGFAERLACIEALWAASGERWHGARVVHAERDRDNIVLGVQHHDRYEELVTRALVVATGRWSPRSIRRWLEALGARFAFRRIEIGIRIEGAAEHPVFARLPGTDGKLVVEPHGSHKIRTFCMCRDGEVVLGRAHGMAAYSGRADGPRTGRSNIGLLVRVEDPALAPVLEPALTSTLPARVPLTEWRDRGVAALGMLGPAAAVVSDALARFAAWAPELAEGTLALYLPCIEGVGDYPVDDGSLAIAPGVWVAGDAGGRFRGIVASMISGRYVARRLQASR